MKPIFSRLLLAVIALPFLFAVVFWLPHAGFLAFHVFCVAGTFIGALEVRDLLAHRGVRVYGWSAGALGATIPAVSYLQNMGISGPGLLGLWITALVSLLLLRALLMNNERDLEALLIRLCASLLILLYPGLFVYFLARLTSFTEASWVLALFFAAVFANDSAAYGAGRLFGSRLNLIISPNKSTIGFVAGFAASIGGALLIFALSGGRVPGGPRVALIVGAALGISTILGDLVESALKRSAHVKDSGTLMMGRGGFLDSIDSMLLSAPLSYLLFTLLS